MITKADDFPIHQISKPVAETGTERNFYDRYFFNGYSKEEDIYFGAVLCVYPNLNIMDGSFTLAYEGKQYNSRVSRYLNLERLDTKVGPLSVEVIEPLNKLKVTLADVENDLDVSIEFTSRFAPMREPQMQLFNGPRMIMDTCRMTQQGSWSGKIVHNKKEISLDDDSFIGTRDRSWGVRPVGAYDSQPMVPFSMPQFYWLWAPIHFDDSAAHIYFVEDEKGNASSTIAIAQGPEYEDEFIIQDINKSVSYHPGTRRVKKMEISGTDDQAKLITISIDCGMQVFMCGLGYMHPEWGHGHDKGELASYFDDYDLNDDPGDPPFLHVQSVSNVTMKIGDKSKTGRGVLEQLILGPHEPSGFKDLFDKP